MKLRTVLPMVLLPLLQVGTAQADSHKIYQTKCMACHASGVAGAPKTGDQNAWTVRLAERGIEGLYSSAIKGRKAMPPKGACFDCTDDQIRQVVDLMIQSGK